MQRIKYNLIKSCARKAIHFKIKFKEIEYYYFGLGEKLK